MSIHDNQPAQIKVEEIKDERPYPGPNGTSIHPNDMGIINIAPDDTKPPPLDLLFGTNSPPRAKNELPLTPPRSPSTSPGPSRPPMHGRNASKKKAAAMEHKPMMVDDLPIAWDEAHATFTALDKCVYETKGLGLSREQDDMMVCDCVYEKRNPSATQCGPQSDCVNRAIYIECLSAECRAKDQCRNQRFSKQEYATLDIVQTEKKGFGLRATHNLPAGSLVYEYIGEVVAEKTFRKRMQQYADEGIRHFYFMMLQKEEYIDATKKGGIGRFANHSCNPNSEVQKWVVGRRLRMGIFTKQDVIKGEEITFNYNVDRYGHDAQTCYCGEPNCVGTIGGKTQTDIGGMGDLLIQALGIAEDVESMEMKGSKKRKARQLDEIDYIPILKPIPDPETAQKVAAAMRQTMENKRVLSYLLQRIKITEDIVVQRQLIRMHGFSLMAIVLTDLADDVLLVTTALEAMMQWKLQEKNKVDDSGIQEPVESFAQDARPEVSGPARRLLEYWSTLKLSYRIARKPKIASLAEEDDAATTTIAEADSTTNAHLDRRRADTWQNEVTVNFNLAPVRRGPPMPAFARPRPPPPPPAAIRTPANSAVAERSRLDAIIALAQQSASTPTRTPVRGVTHSPSASSPRGSSSMPSPPPRPVEEIWAEEERRKKQEKEREREKRKRRHQQQQQQQQSSASSSSTTERDDKRAKKLIGDVVVPIMSKHKQKMDRDQFKRFAQQCTELLMEKEKKGKDYGRFCRLTTLPDEKRKKIQNFANDYTVRLLKKMEAKTKSKEATGEGAESNGNGSSSGNGSTSHEPSMTPGDSFMVATPELPGSTPAKDEENYGDSDLEMDIDIDAELEDHTFSVVKDKASSS